MTNSLYNRMMNPSPGATVRSASLINEFNAVSAGFAKVETALSKYPSNDTVFVSGGNVGIGGLNAAYKLHVLDGYFGVRRGASYNQSAETGVDIGLVAPDAVDNGKTYAYGLKVSGNANGQTFAINQYRRNAPTTTALSIDSWGTFSIASASLQMQETTRRAVINCGYDGQLDYTTFGTNPSSVTGVSSYMAFYTGTFSGYSEKMRLDASGNLLVGTTSNTGTYRTRISRSGGNVLALETDQTSTVTQLAFFNPNGAVGTMQTNGSTTTFTPTSDYRLKNNVRPADAKRFMEIEFVDYEWVDGQHDCGVIADKLQQIYPSLVYGDKDATEIRQVEVTPAIPAVVDEEGNEVAPAIEAVTEPKEFPVYQRVNYQGLIGRMGTVVQRHDRTLEQQAKLIELLTNRIAALEQRK